MVKLVVVGSREKYVALLFMLLLVAAWMVYQPAIEGPFLLDDYDNLGLLSNNIDSLGGLNYYLSHGNAGPLGRPIAKLSFLLDDNAWPSEASSNTKKKPPLGGFLNTTSVLLTTVRRQKLVLQIAN
jgi:hypothetical protein